MQIYFKMPDGAMTSIDMPWANHLGPTIADVRNYAHNMSATAETPQETIDTLKASIAKLIAAHALDDTILWSAVPAAIVASPAFLNPLREAAIFRPVFYCLFPQEFISLA